MATLEEKILSGDFIYDPPYFYRNAWALRCKLGIGDSDEVFYAVARKRAAEIFTILFRNGVDMFFFDHCVYDYDFFVHIGESDDRFALNGDECQMRGEQSIPRADVDFGGRPSVALIAGIVFPVDRVHGLAEQGNDCIAVR